MGAEPWSYLVPYQPDVEAALEALKQQEFAAGRYNMGYSAVQTGGGLALVENGPAATIEEALERTDADGTRSILDMMGVSDTPHEVDSEDPQFGFVAPLSAEQLIGLYGTDKPTRAIVGDGGDVFELIDRGLGVYVIVYDGDRPSELFFAGYSYD